MAGPTPIPGRRSARRRAPAIARDQARAAASLGSCRTSLSRSATSASRRERSPTRLWRSASAGPAIFWAWPLVILGQTFVALNFAELSSHFPVAGSIYQWSKRLSNRTLGWFTGWIYFWAGVITVTAVAATVPLVLSTIYPDTIKLADSVADPVAATCSRSSG